MIDGLPSSALVFLFTFLTGACIGSFLNVCIARWPAGLSVVSPASRCPNCERGIRAHENVPILGWLTLRGRCAGCSLPISAQYPLIELLVALVWAGSVVAYGPTFTAVRVAVFATVLLGVAVTDAKHYLIPDGFTVFGLVWVIVTAFAGLFLQGPSPFAGAYDALIGAFVGAGAIAVAGWLGEVALKREAMGFGDVKLMAVAGAALGPNRALLTIFIAAALGLVGFALVILPFMKLTAR
ncbi:MAG: prepilin peptidase, partial [Gemmatimonadaceae bacterium]